MAFGPASGTVRSTFEGHEVHDSMSSAVVKVYRPCKRYENSKYGRVNVTVEKGERSGCTRLQLFESR